MIYYNNENMVKQSFPFRQSLVEYVFKNMDGNHLLKLYQTCKFFYDKFKFNIIENLTILDNWAEDKIVKNSVTGCPGMFYEFTNLWIFNKVDLTCGDAIYLEPNFRNTIKELSIRFEDWENFKILTKSPFLRKVYVGCLECLDSEDSIMLEDVIAELPHATSITCDDQNSTPETMAKLISLERDIKITEFHLVSQYGFFDPKQVAEFFKKHATPDVVYSIHFDDDSIAEKIGLPENIDEMQRAERIKKAKEQFDQILKEELKP